MINNIIDLLDDHLEILLSLKNSKSFQNKFYRAVDLCTHALKEGNKILIFGNGGSAADAQHMAAEFIGKFGPRSRKALPAISLTTDTSILTALANDFGYDTIFSRQIEALGNKGDIAIAISTSGESKNVLAGIQAAHKKALKTIAFTGGFNGKINKMCDVTLVVPSKVTSIIQEIHLFIEHSLIGMIEENVCGSNSYYP